MNVVSLQQPQRDPKWRMGFIGGSDAVKIIRGDWHDLYNEKIGHSTTMPICLIYLTYN
jgi:hypothetical protein